MVGSYLPIVLSAFFLCVFGLGASPGFLWDHTMMLGMKTRFAVSQSSALTLYYLSDPQVGGFMRKKTGKKGWVTE